MKNKVKALFKTLVQDIIKPSISYILLFVVVFALFLGIAHGLIWVFNFFFPNNGENVLLLVIQVLLGIFLIVLLICWVIEYFQDTIIPNYKNKLKQLDAKDKKC